jgi:hypothetical protein
LTLSQLFLTLLLTLRTCSLLKRHLLLVAQRLAARTTATLAARVAQRCGRLRRLRISIRFTACVLLVSEALEACGNISHGVRVRHVLHLACMWHSTLTTTTAATVAAACTRRRSKCQSQHEAQIVGHTHHGVDVTRAH